MTVDEIKRYAQEFLTKQGVAAERVSAIVETLGDPTVGKAFADGFVPRPEYSRDLDKQRDEWQAKHSQAEQVAQTWQKWYTDEAKPYWDQTKRKVALADQYEKLYGTLEGEAALTGPTHTAAVPADAVTRKEMEELRARLDSVASAAEVIPAIELDHFERFGKRIPREDFTAFLEKNKPPDIKTGYDRFIEPRVKEIEAKNLEVQLQKAREEGARDALSKHKLPIAPAHREPHPFFDARPEASEKLTPVQQDDRAEQAFIRGWEEATAQPT